MGEQAIQGAITVGLAIVGVGLLAVFVSKNAQTPQVLSSLGSAFSGALSAAEAPVTGGGGFTNYNSGFSGGGVGYSQMI